MAASAASISARDVRVEVLPDTSTRRHADLQLLPSTSARRRRRATAGAGLELAALVQDLDAALGLLEPRVAEAGQLHAALVQLQRRLERQVAFFELLHDRLELGDRRFEVLDGGIHVSLDCLSVVTSHVRVRRVASVTRTRSPCARRARRRRG